MSLSSNEGLTHAVSGDRCITDKLVRPDLGQNGDDDVDVIRLIRIVYVQQAYKV